MDTTTTEHAELLAALATFPASEHLSVGKDGFNEFFSFSYATEPALFTAARAALTEAGLSATISFEQATHEIIQTFDKEGRERPGILATVAARLTLRDANGNAVECVAYGMGLDPADKALAKAETQASKIVVQKALMIAVASDDTDAGHPGAVGRRASNGGSLGGTASEKQLGFLCSLVKKHHISGDGTVEEMVLRFARMQGDSATEFAKISKQTASDLIERFQKLPDGRGQDALDRMRQWEAENGYAPTPSDADVPFQERTPADNVVPVRDDDTPF